MSPGDRSKCCITGIYNTEKCDITGKTIYTMLCNMAQGLFLGLAYNMLYFTQWGYTILLQICFFCYMACYIYIRVP